MLKLCRVTKLKVFFPVLVYVFNFDLFEFSAAILEKGLLSGDDKVTFLAPLHQTPTRRIALLLTTRAREPASRLPRDYN